ncbi:hypothetical protein C5167_004145 [Papaver somniferum]|nr:hypothetical protein C5167_004145 [Papaver somniferum]
MNARVNNFLFVYFQDYLLIFSYDLWINLLLLTQVSHFQLSRSFLGLRSKQENNIRDPLKVLTLDIVALQIKKMEGMVVL